MDKELRMCAIFAIAVLVCTFIGYQLGNKNYEIQLEESIKFHQNRQEMIYSRKIQELNSLIMRLNHLIREVCNSNSEAVSNV